MLKTAAFVVLHLIPLILASTAFTAITAPLDLAPFNWNSFAYTYADGWGARLFLQSHPTFREHP